MKQDESLKRPGKLTKEYVRENFPECVGVADAFRAEFGDGVKMVHAREGGKEIGKPGVAGVLVEVDVVREKKVGVNKRPSDRQQRKHHG